MKDIGKEEKKVFYDLIKRNYSVAAFAAKDILTGVYHPNKLIAMGVLRRDVEQAKKAIREAGLNLPAEYDYAG